MTDMHIKPTNQLIPIIQNKGNFYTLYNKSLDILLKINEYHGYKNSDKTAFLDFKKRRQKQIKMNDQNVRKRSIEHLDMFIIMSSPKELKLKQRNIVQ